MEFTVEVVEKLITTSPKKNGSFNLFFKLNDKLAIKLSVAKNHRDSNYKNQTKAASLGLGPETYGTIDNVKYDGKYYFGYFTEIVQIMSEDIWKDSDFGEFLDFIWEEEGKELEKQIKEKVFDWEDYSCNNIGWKNGKLVCIDFDDFRAISINLLWSER